MSSRSMPTHYDSFGTDSAVPTDTSPPTSPVWKPILRAYGLVRASGPWLLRGSLALVFVWLGALKLAGVSTLSSSMIAAITPSLLDAELVIRVVGGVEIVLGLGLLVRSVQPYVVAAVAAQLAATFLVMVVRPDVTFADGNLLLLSVEGEYILKNIVLLAGALTLVHWMPAARSSRARSSAPHQLEPPR